MLYAPSSVTQCTGRVTYLVPPPSKDGALLRSKILSRNLENVFKPCESIFSTQDSLRPLHGVTFKLYHTTFTKKNIALVSELNIKKATQCCVTKSTGYDLNVTPERGRGHSYHSYIFLSNCFEMWLRWFRYTGCPQMKNKKILRPFKLPPWKMDGNFIHWGVYLRTPCIKKKTGRDNPNIFVY